MEVSRRTCRSCRGGQEGVEQQEVVGAEAGSGSQEVVRAEVESGFDVVEVSHSLFLLLSHVRV